jgi:topoisomerase-4 subunit B
MNPDTRRAMRVEFDASTFDNTNKIMNMLMAKQESGTRRAWLEFHGNEVNGDV